MMIEDSKWNKATRLAVAGLVAPHLRDQSAKAARRRVAKVDKDGKVVGYTTLAEVQQALLHERKIELETVEGVEPKEFFCEECGRPFERPPRTIRKRCDRCTFLSCTDCGKALPRNYSSPSMRSKGSGSRVPICRPCKMARTAAATPTCSVCAVALLPNSEWQWKRRWGDCPLMCGVCSRKSRLLPVPTCGSCGKTLKYSARTSVRVKSGKPPLCRDCYRGDARREVMRDKLATDPAFAEKVAENLAKRHKSSERAVLPRKTCGGCDKLLGFSTKSSMCRSCAHRYRHAVSPMSPETRKRIGEKNKLVWRQKKQQIEKNDDEA